MLVRDFLEHSAQSAPGKVALVFQGERRTYGQIEAMANRLANALVDTGVQRGDRVGIFLGNCVEAVVSVFAVLKADAVFTIIGATTKEQKLAYMLDNCSAVALISSAQLWAVASAACRQVSSLRCVILAGAGDGATPMAEVPVLDWERVQCSCSDHLPSGKCIDIDLAALIYTSGSTGFPKGVMATHLNMVTASTSITTYLENTPDDVVMNVLPLSFDYGLYQVLMAFMVGATLVLERGFTYPQVVLNDMATERVTGLPGVPTVFAMLLQQKTFTEMAFPHLRYFTNTAAALPVEHIRRLREAFPHVAIYSMYGLTECKRVSYLPPAELDQRPASVGIAIPNTEVWIEGEDGQPVGPNAVGELVVRGSHVARGYWGEPEETAKVFRPGRLPGEVVLHTGDLFWADQQGFLYFVARKDDMIKSRGEKVSPREVEDVLYRLDGVAEAAVVGVPDPVLGQAIKACIVLQEGRALSEQAVIAHCRRFLESFMVPSIVTFCAELPKTESGKVRRPCLC